MLRTRAMLAACVILALSVCAAARTARGELRIQVRDPQRASLSAKATLVSESAEVQRSFEIDSSGRYTASELPFGIYRLKVEAQGFAPFVEKIEIRSELPVAVEARLEVAPVQSMVEVTEAATLLDPKRTGAQISIGTEAVREQQATQPGRDLMNLVVMQPGWLYEANGILHPRGSEYEVQFVQDGMPLTQNRSPSFAPPFDADEVDSLRVLTSNYPAEYGRKLGGIVEVTTQRDFPEGWHGELDLQGGAFDTGGGTAGLSFSDKRGTLDLAGYGFHTSRYLDPPVLENFTNEADSGGVSASYQLNLSDRDRLIFSFAHRQSSFQVPNELVQQEAGQLQTQAANETSGQLSYQHVISSGLLLQLAGSFRDERFTLDSNQFSTPVIVHQDRGYREGYLQTNLAGHKGHHDWKIGADVLFAPVREALEYHITDPSQFDPGTQQDLNFHDHRWDVEPAVYIQDEIHYKNWNISAGLRFDAYDFVVRKAELSPRIGVSRFFPSLNLLLHVAYDRAFQTPAMENLLLASSPQLNSVSDEVLRLPVQPGYGNFYEAGFTKTFWDKVRLDANVFQRDFTNYADDDVLLNTGVSFPIAFRKAHIFGEEVRLESPAWGRFSGFLSYANQSATAQGPVTGGLFLGDEASDALSDTDKFAVSQDQRNTLRLQVRAQATKKLWISATESYGSGLPAELDGAVDYKFLLSQYGQQILNEVNFNRGRVKPNFSFDLAAGFELYHKEQRSASAQIQVVNLTNNTNVINFASLFSGTAVGIPRSVSARLRFGF